LLTLSIFQRVGFLGGVVAALFSAYAIQKVPVVEWGRRMVNDVLPKCVEYLKKTERNFAEYSAGTHLTYFVDAWKTYLAERQIANDGQNTPVFPEDFGVSERDKFYKQISFSGWGGSSGHDSVIIAYDALLGSGDDWIEFLKRGALHGGDSDSTAAIGAAWFGALYGYKGVPEVHYKDLEYGDRLKVRDDAM
jgi:ADP-ribosylarginine hydrolase